MTVKGLAERDVKADLAIWPLRFVATGNELGAVRAKIVADEAAVREFVDDAGLQSASVEVTGFEVTDALAQIYRSGPVESRFVVAETLVVRSTDIDGVRAAGPARGRTDRGGRRPVQRGGRGLGSGLSVHRPERGQAGDGGRGHAQRPRKRVAVRRTIPAAGSAASAAPARACSRSWPATRRRD